MPRLHKSGQPTAPRACPSEVEGSNGRKERREYDRLLRRGDKLQVTLARIELALDGLIAWIGCWCSIRH
jgi:hypothetical protein